MDARIAVTSLLLAIAPELVESTHTPAPASRPQALTPGHAAGGTVEYPRAKQYIPAHPSNQVEGGLTSPQHVIVHTQEGVYDGTISWFQYAGSNVSTHYVMRSVDGEITQMVDHGDMAQHIGGYNPSSFGIEHEGFIYEPGWYTWETYVESARLTRWLCDHYQIPIDRQHILGHVEVPGATHTDPGPYWDWAMYMALIDDVVGEGRIEGVVVDRSRPCTLTATDDTWITTTLETLDMLDDDEVCFLAAGSELTYLHASSEMISQHRLTLDDDGPCGGAGVSQSETYIWAPSFTPVCPAADAAVTDDITVMLDGTVTDVGDDGTFVFAGVAAGPHTIDVDSEGAWQATTVVVEVEEYPGLRVVIAVDPAGEPPPGGGETGDVPEPAGESGGGSSGNAQPEPSMPDDEPEDVDTDDGSPLVPANSPPMSAGCGCRTRSGPVGPAALVLVVGLVSIRRRRRAVLR